MEWQQFRLKKPHKWGAYDITLDDKGARLINVGIYRPLEDNWELLIDKHNYQDCKVVAWKERTEPYEGKV